MKKRNAFTIIEVVLVLAIAGLIFLMVFIALPALQRSQRNTRRRQDVARISSAVTTYYSNTGKMPFSRPASGWGSYVLDYDFIKNYIDSNIVSSGAETQDNDGDFAVSCGDNQTCEEFSDPNGSVYQVSLYDITAALGSDSGNMNKIFFNPSKQCDAGGDTKVVSGGSAASMFAVGIVLEGGAVYCADNS